MAQAWEAQKQAIAARSWQTAVGRVILSEVQETTVRVRVRTSANRYRLAMRYKPYVLYEYQVGGAAYRGERLVMGTAVLSSEASDAAQEAVRYPLGREVTVYYNPANPHEATLDPHIGQATKLIWLVALLLLLMTVITIGFLLQAGS